MTSPPTRAEPLAEEPAVLHKKVTQAPNPPKAGPSAWKERKKERRRKLLFFFPPQEGSRTGGDHNDEICGVFHHRV